MPNERESEIRLIVYALREYWLKNPDWRLGQLLMNVSRNPDGSVLTDLWNRYDRDWERDFND